MLKKPIYLICE